MKTTLIECLPNNSANDDNRPGLASLMHSPWALPGASFSELQVMYAAHLRNPKLDILALEASIGFSLDSQQHGYQVDRGVAVIQIAGLMVNKANLLTRAFGATSAQWIERQLRSAVADASIHSIVLAIDSPGGSVNGTPELAAAVFHAAQSKPVVAHSDAVLTGAAYWVASAANEVYISGPTVQVGAIGIVTMPIDDPELARQRPRMLAGRWHSGAASRPSHFQHQVNHLYGVFVNQVAAYRGVTPDFARKTMAGGRVFIGQQALAARLVDDIKPLDALVHALATDPIGFAKRRRVLMHRVRSQPPVAACAGSINPMAARPS